MRRKSVCFACTSGLKDIKLFNYDEVLQKLIKMSTLLSLKKKKALGKKSFCIIKTGIFEFYQHDYVFG